MAVYNSHIGSLQDDSDITIINPSIIPEHDDDEYVDNTYVPIITRLKQANHSSENRQTTNSQTINNNNNNNNNPVPNAVGNDGYIFVDHDPLKNAKQLEQVLTSYIRDLKQDSNTQLVCDKLLVTRILDLIRPAYLDDQQKMSQLDHIMAEIGQLHDKRHIAQKEEIEHLRMEKHRLNRVLVAANNNQTTYNNSMFSLSQRGFTSIDQDQWTEIEDDAKKLNELVELQKKQINEIVSLISHAAEASVTIDSPNIPENNPGDTPIDNRLTAFSSTNSIYDILNKIKTITGDPSQPKPLQKPAITNHSPGASPSDSINSLASLTFKTLTPSNQDTTKEVETPVNRKEPTIETSVYRKEPIINIPVVPPPTPAVPPPTPVVKPPTPAPQQPIPQPETKKCPVCNYEFPPTSDDVEMYDHIEKCLFPMGAVVKPADYECPNCHQKFPGNNDTDYLQHLSECYNRDF